MDSTSLTTTLPLEITPPVMDMPAGGQHHHTGGYPDVVVDGDAVVLMLPLGGVDVVGSGDDFRIRTDDDMIADGDGIAEVYLVGLDADMVTNGEVGVGTLRQGQRHDNVVANGGTVAARYPYGFVVLEVLFPTGSEPLEIMQGAA